MSTCSIMKLSQVRNLPENYYDLSVINTFGNQVNYGSHACSYFATCVVRIDANIRMSSACKITNRWLACLQDYINTLQTKVVKEQNLVSSQSLKECD